jgi:hypothetical protein|tara:strand:+ start:3484 stop:3612 length:129 start_codon:yes stop_codon:yes gene_type:complete
MTINELIKEFKRTFNNVNYKATSKDGLVFKTKDWDKVSKKFK